MNKKIKTPWCINPFISVSHTSSGYYRPCCVAKESNKYNVNDITFEEYYKSEEMINLRKDMFNEVFSKETNEICNHCIINKKNNIKSKNDFDNEKYLKKQDTIRTLELYENGICDESNIQYLNIKMLGNFCNFKCIMCNGESSSKIALENKKHNLISIDSKDILIPYEKIGFEKYLHYVEKIMYHCKKIMIVGGEPLIHPNFKKLYYMLLNHKNRKKIIISISTNLSVIPDYLLNYDNEFRYFSITSSIDGVSRKGEYIRNGLNWEIYDKNIKKILQNKNIHSFCNFSTQTLNIGYVDEIFDYLESISFNKNNINLSHVTNPLMFNPINLPKEIKEYYLSYYSNFDFDKTGNIKNILTSKKYSHKDFMKGIQRLKFLDKIRNQCLLDEFPEFSKYYNQI